MDAQCAKCDAKCCKYFCFEIDEPDCFEEFDDIRWFLAHEGVTIHIEDGDWFISIANRCKMLDEDNRCTIYDDRPLICRGYDLDNCDHTSGDYGYDEEFHTPEEMDAYTREALGPKKYDRQKAKHRAKLTAKLKKKQPIEVKRHHHKGE